jgi:hypothetical protein
MLQRFNSIMGAIFIEGGRLHHEHTPYTITGTFGSSLIHLFAFDQTHSNYLTNGQEKNDAGYQGMSHQRMDVQCKK